MLHRSVGRDPKFKTKKVCRECNNGWMSDLETAVRSTMGGLVNDISMRLDEEQQRLLAQTDRIGDGAHGCRNPSAVVLCEL